MAQSRAAQHGSLRRSYRIRHRTNGSRLCVGSSAADAAPVPPGIPKRADACSVIQAARRMDSDARSLSGNRSAGDRGWRDLTNQTAGRAASFDEYRDPSQPVPAFSKPSGALSRPRRTDWYIRDLNSDMPLNCHYRARRSIRALPRVA